MSNLRTNMAYPAHSAQAVTPSDSTVVLFRGLYVGTGGDLVVDMVDGATDVTFTNVQDGSILPIAVSKIKAATTATSIVGLS